MRRSSRILAVLWLFVLCRPALGQLFPVDTLLDNGPPADRINLVFLAEGYRSTEMADFHTDVQGILNGLLAASPLSSYQAYFNAYAVQVPSVESGTDHPGSASDEPGGFPVQFRNTYFNSTFDASGVHRALVADDGKVLTVLQNNFPMWDAAFVIVNTDWYGGTGGTVSTFSTHSSSTEIALHEMGHSFGNLADEYDYGGWPGHESPNSTAVTDRPQIRWNVWILPTTPVPTPETGTYSGLVGLFEGAVYNLTGWFRPKLNCKMQSLGVPFCEVCREQMVKVTYGLVDPVEQVQPVSTSPEVPYDSTALFSVTTLAVTPNTMAVSWTVDGDPVFTGTDFDFQAEVFDTGQHVVTALVADTTPWVRIDPGGLLQTTHQWTVRVLPPSFYVGDTNGDRVITSADVIVLVNHVFKGGPPSTPVEAGDVDCSGVTTSSDIIVLVNYIFKSGLQPDC